MEVQNYIELFGKEKVNFKPETLTAFMEEGKIDEAKQYIAKYFLMVEKGQFIKYNPVGYGVNDDKYELLKKERLCDDIPVISVKVKVDENVEVKKKIDLIFWFMYKSGLRAKRTLTMDKSMLFVHHEQTFFNMFQGYRFNINNEFTMTDELKGKVKQIWEHIKIVWCGRDEEQFDYVHKWIASSFVRKMESCLYLQSGQGTGKSIITNFLQNVFGKAVCLIANTPEQIVGKFNSSIEGKCMVILEELPSYSKNEWNSNSDKLKDLIVGKVMRIELKNHEPYNALNFMSFIILTNHFAIKMEADQRRLVSLDVSSEMVGNYKYFDNLADICKDDKVQEAFFRDCIAYANTPESKNFKENRLPQTNNDKAMRVSQLPNHIYFIKQKYVLKHLGIDTHFKDLYDEYERKADGFILPKASFSNALTAMGIKVYHGAQNKMKVFITKEDLLAYYDKRHYIHDTDDFYSEEREKQKENEELIKIKRKNEIEELKADKDFYENNGNKVVINNLYLVNKYGKVNNNENEEEEEEPKTVKINYNYFGKKYGLTDENIEKDCDEIMEMFGRNAMPTPQMGVGNFNPWD